MSTITVKGKFTGSVNNFVILDVFRANSLPYPYDFRKMFDGDFEEVITDLREDTKYKIDITGFTYGNFELEISGEFADPNPITEDDLKGSFSPGYTIHTN
jgi:hypothetical protein